MKASMVEVLEKVFEQSNSFEEAVEAWEKEEEKARLTMVDVQLFDKMGDIVRLPKSMRIKECNKEELPRVKSESISEVQEHLRHLDPARVGVVSVNGQPVYGITKHPMTSPPQQFAL